MIWDGFSIFTLPFEASLPEYFAFLQRSIVLVKRRSYRTRMDDADHTCRNDGKDVLMVNQEELNLEKW